MDNDRAHVGNAIGELWLFAYHNGYAEPGTQPPHVDPSRLAAYCRAILDEMNTQSNRHARCAMIEVENDRLHSDLEAMIKQLARLRAELEAEREKNRPNPDEEKDR